MDNHRRTQEPKDCCLPDSRERTAQAIAETFGINRSTIYRHLNPARPGGEDVILTGAG
ncbi:MAG TPA: HTH domain-containing protein [Actinomycetota bacterium]|jgi:predicted ArsR family transcriptional regulator|nr:HTH domain-containing protein [Actinomycetota bacterium]